MLLGKITRDGENYVVKVGGIFINITEDVYTLIAQESARTTALLAQENTRLTGIVGRYNQIVEIVLASDTVRPIG
jgi:hypothetical protein